MKLKVYTPDGASFSEKEFARIPVFEGAKGRMALRQTILAIQANLRQGNASAKTKAEVSGSGKKPFRQKGTGRARQGSTRSPLHPGGGVVFGPKPRDYSQKVNKKVKRLALSRALFDRASQEGVTLIEKWQVAEAKTKLFAAVVNLIRPTGKVLVVDTVFGDHSALAARNIERVYLAEVDSLNAFDLVRFDQVVFSEQAFDKLLNRINGGAA